MEIQGDLAVQDLDNLYPKIRSNLRFTFQIIKNVPCYVIDDPVNSRYYRVGVAEYKFLSLLNGKRSVISCMKIMADSLGEDSLSQQEIVQILHWLANVSLLETNAPDEAQQQWNFLGLSAGISKILFPKVPFGSPNKFLNYVLPLFRPILGKIFFFIWIILLSLSIYLVFSQWNRFASTANKVLVLNNWLHLAIVWILLKVIHEFWHGLVCKYHGSEVRETGILFILFIPMGYVDTSNSWNISSKWKRIHIALAGMKIELLIASIAAIIWSETPAGELNQICYEIILMASITTLFFNANPLMRFDGYYALADYLEEVNLYTRSKNYLQYLGKKYILGVACSFADHSWRTCMLLFTYGLGAFLWRVLIYAGIALGTSLLFLGAGIALSILYIIVFGIFPLARLLKYMFIGNSTERPPLLRATIITTGIVYFVYATFTSITWQKGLEAPGVITYEKLETVRVYCPGFVKEIYVKSGDYVQKGQLLIYLDNKEAITEYRQLLSDIKKTKYKIRQYSQEDLVAAKIEREKLSYFKKRKKQQKKYLDSLKIYAPIEGIVATRNLLHLKSTYLSAGKEVLTIFHPDTQQLVVAIAQEDIEQYQILLRKKDLQIYIPVLENTFSGKLDQIDPTATRNIFHPALTSIGGGSIPVQQDTQGNYQFVAPHFRAEISLLDKFSLRGGCRGYVRIYEEKRTLGKIIYYQIENWINDTWSQNF